MRPALLIAALVAVVLALPAAARADGIVADCTTPSGTAPCSTGWYTTDVTVSFVLPGGSSNPQGCGNYPISTDTPGTTITCTVSVSGTQCCRLDVTIKRDATPPTATSITAARGPDANGWYNHPVGVTVAGSDATSGIVTCTSVTYAGPDAASASVTGTCTDSAGNVSAPLTLSFQYDATAPTVTAAPSRGPDANGWYNHPVDVAFQATDAVSGVADCGTATYPGPDGASASVSGTCHDRAGNTGTGTFSLRYDATPPTITGATPDRPPDRDGWYNHRLVVTFAGGDATSGIASCDAPAYDKPNTDKATVTGRCRDNAGNVSQPGSFAFKFDSARPKLAKLTATPGDGSATLRWTASRDVAEVQVVRTRSGTKPVTVYQGRRVTAFTDRRLRNGHRYSYLVTAVDAAGNTTSGRTQTVPGAALVAPAQGARVRGSTTLRWRPQPGATYYNVQVWLGSRKILTTWPTSPRLGLPRLAPGAYTWFVWPGRGARTAHRYGPLVGRSTFVVRR